MKRDQLRVPFGYEPPQPKRKGSVFVYETFEDWTAADLTRFVQWADERQFARVVLFPQHEETIRRMGVACGTPYYERVKQLEGLIQELHLSDRVHLDEWEGKRKKYTPIDTSLRFLTEKYHGPYFVAMNDQYANLFVTYSTFEAWIKKVRLFVLVKYRVPVHSKLLQFTERWESFELTDGF